jgi:GNAT superfamily N-acetyltransferase
VSEVYRIEPLSEEHDRSHFISGSTSLDRYFHTQATQDLRRRITTCFVAISRDTDEIAGYYTLSATSIALDALPAALAKKLPRYPVVPAALLGRLAVARSHQNRGLGGALLADALIRSARTELGVFAVVVDAKDEAALRFYEHHKFRLLAGETRRLYVPIDDRLRRLVSP